MIPREFSLRRLTWVLSAVAIVLALLVAGNDYVSARSRQQAIPRTNSTGQTGSTGQGRSSIPQDPGHRTGGPPVPGQRPDFKPWWQDDVIKKEIGLTPDQAQKILAIYDQVRPELEKYFQERDKESKELDRLMSIRADDVTVMMQIDRVEALRTVFNKRRTMMFYRMHKVLTREQDEKLKAITSQQDRGRRGGPPKN